MLLVAARGGIAESVAAAQFWAECVRREHHAWKFNSEPRLFAPLAAMQDAAAANNWRRLLRFARIVRDRFRKDEHAYCPRIRVWRPSKRQLCLSMSPMFYHVGRAEFLGSVFLHVSLWFDGVWRCEAICSAFCFEGRAFPAFDGVFYQPGLQWDRLQMPTPESHAPKWPNLVINYGRPYRDVPP